MPGYLPKPPVCILNRAHPLARGLVAAWPFDEGGGGKTVRDAVGSNHGTAQAYNKWTGGKFGHCMAFNGTSDYVGVGTASTLDITSEITLSAWVSLNSIVDVDIISKSNPSPVAPYHQYILHISSKSKLYLAGDDGGTVRVYAIDTTNFPVGGWHHAVATHDGVWSRLYIDGIQRVAANTYTGGFVSHPTWPLNIGKVAYGTYFPNGSIDDVRLYNRALSAQEVAAVYADPWAIYRPSRGWLKVALMGAWWHRNMIRDRRSGVR